MQYLLRIGDTCLDPRASASANGAAMRRSLEEDIALDQHRARPRRPGARAAHARRRSSKAESAATTRTSSPSCATSATSCNVTLVELPRGDFAVTCCATSMVATLLQAAVGSASRRRATPSSRRSPARPSRKRATTSSMRATGWCAWATARTNRARRMQRGARRAVAVHAELFEADAVDEQLRRAASARAGPSCRRAWHGRGAPVLAEAGARVPGRRARSAAPARRGVHSEHMGYILAEMQHLQRAFPEACGDARAGASRTRARRAGAWDVLGTRARPRGAGDLGARPRHRARRVASTATALEVVLTPTYSGCPATEVIEHERGRRDRRRRPRPGRR